MAFNILPHSPPNSSNIHYLSSLGILSLEERCYHLCFHLNQRYHHHSSPLFSSSLLPTYGQVLALPTYPSQAWTEIISYQSFCKGLQASFLYPLSIHPSHRGQSVLLKFWSNSITQVNTCQWLSLLKGQELKENLGIIGGEGGRSLGVEGEVVRNTWNIWKIILKS